MAASLHNHLLVEGKLDRLFVAELLESSGIPWPRGLEPIDIRELDGLENLTDERMDLEIKARELRNLGILLDANGDGPVVRWSRMRGLLSPFATLPESPPKGGAIVAGHGIRFGLWIMPDNASTGMLETFVAQMLRPQDEPLWDHAKASARLAAGLGARYRDAHADKAFLHTFLAWQDPPGPQVHQAMGRNTFDATRGQGQAFIKWCKELFELP